MTPHRAFNSSPAKFKAIRLRLNKTPSAFVFILGVRIAALQNWEQGRRTPEGPARALLKIAVEKLQVLIEALSA
jgi:putative transcriptional regulator